MNDITTAPQGTRASYDEQTKLDAVILTLGSKTIAEAGDIMGIPESNIKRWRSQKRLRSKAETIFKQRELEKQAGINVTAPDVVGRIERMVLAKGVEAAATGDLRAGKEVLDAIAKAATTRRALRAEERDGKHKAATAFETDPSKI